MGSYIKIEQMQKYILIIFEKVKYFSFFLIFVTVIVI